MNKAKAEGTCLVIHKGTAQCAFSPTNKNKSDVPKTSNKESYPLVLVQEGGSTERKVNKSIFANLPKRNNLPAGNKSTGVNLPPIANNKKLVKIAKAM